MICKSDFWFGHSDKESLTLGEVVDLIRALERQEIRGVAFDLIDPKVEVFEPVDELDLIEGISEAEWEVILSAGMMRSRQLIVEEDRFETAVALLDELEMTWIGRLTDHVSACTWLGVPLIPKMVLTAAAIAA